MATQVVFALTLVMIAVHVGEWLLLGQLASTAKQGSSPARSPFTRVFGLMNFLRFEAFYYVVLVVFWLFHSEAVPWVWVIVLGAIHVGGWAAIEGRKRLPQLEAVALVAARNPEGQAAASRLRRVLGGIALFDAAEVAVLAYIAYRLWSVAF